MGHPIKNPQCLVIYQPQMKIPWRRISLRSLSRIKISAAKQKKYINLQKMKMYRNSV